MADANQGPHLVIGLTGPLGAGVSTVAAALRDHGKFRAFTLSDAIKQELRKREDLPEPKPLQEIPGWRKKLQDIGNEGRQKSPRYWLETIRASIPTDEDVVIDGIRNTSEATGLRDWFPHFFLIAVIAPPDVRWRRVQAEYRGNFKEFEEADRRDSDEDVEYGQQVTRCIQLADYVLLNDEDLGSSTVRVQRLYEKLEQEVRLMRAVDQSARESEFIRPPDPDEVNMAVAYAQSHMSQCLKRHVGAVIVGPNGLPLSLGYNENPEGMKPCRSEYTFCFKDEDMHKKLEAMNPVHCPSCGEPTGALKQPWKCPKCGENLKLKLFPSRNMELCTAIHAEERAIRSLHGRSAASGTLYTTTFPCFQCARYIVDAGIKRVVYVEAYPVKESADFLERNGVSVEPFRGFKARAFNLIFKQAD
jgi:deoxycytidylate deaminase